MLQAKPTQPEEQAKFISLGDVSRGKLGMQAQYASRHVDGIFPEYPDVASDPAFGEGLRVYGSEGDYHSYMIHQDDADEFVKRVRQHRDST